MGPKSKKTIPPTSSPSSPSFLAPPTSPSPSYHDLASQLAELKTIMSGYAARFDKLEGILEDTKRENKELKNTLDDKNTELLQLKEKLIAQEQYNRGWSIRILNLPIPENEASDPEAVMRHVFARVLEPIFRGALEQGRIREMPKVESVLETAHILPSKPNSINPIIARFYTRNIRAMMFQLKKEFAPRLPADRSAGRQNGATNQHQQGGRFCFPFYEDLTRASFMKMRALSQHSSVQSAWSVNGIIKYRLVNDPTIRKVKSVLASVEDILK